MQFTVDRDVLSEAVSWTARALPARPAAPILAGVRINAHDQAVTFSSFDYEVSATVDIPASIEETGEVLVSGKLLAEISKSLPNKPVHVEEDGQKVTITCGSFRSALAVMPLEEYPPLPSQPELRGAVDSQEFARAIQQVSVAASRDETLPTLTGVFVEIDGEDITLLATDRYRLAMRELKWTPADPAFESQALVKARILGEVAKSMSGGSTIQIGLSDASSPGHSSLVGFSAEGRQTTSTLMEGDYPPVRRLFPESTSIHAVINRQVLLEAVKRVSLVAERKTSVRMVFSDGRLLLEAGQGDNAQASEALEVQLFGDDVTTAFNPQFLIDGLTVMDTEFVRFGFTHGTKPAVMTGQTEIDGGEVTDFRYLAMPIRFGI